MYSCPAHFRNTHKQNFIFFWQIDGTGYIQQIWRVGWRCSGMTEAIWEKFTKLPKAFHQKDKHLLCSAAGLKVPYAAKWF